MGGLRSEGLFADDFLHVIFFRIVDDPGNVIGGKFARNIYKNRFTARLY